MGSVYDHVWPCNRCRKMSFTHDSGLCSKCDPKEIAFVTAHRLRKEREKELVRKFMKDNNITTVFLS